MRMAAAGLTAVLVYGVLANPVAARQREIPSAAATIADELATTSKRTVAVVDFTDLQGNVTELGRFVAEEVSLGLVTSKKGLTVIDRTHLKALMQEHKLGASGIIDPATARRLGQIAGVEALLTGTITPFADSVRVVVKVLDTETARVLAATSLDITKNKTIEELMGKDIRGAEGQAGTTSAPPRRDPPAGTLNVPTFQNDRLKVSVVQMAVTSGNSSATLSLAVENVTQQAVLLGIESSHGVAGGPPGTGYVPNLKVALSDDRATGWKIEALNGVKSVNLGARGLSEEIFTVLGPSERINVVMAFRQRRGGPSLERRSLWPWRQPSGWGTARGGFRSVSRASCQLCRPGNRSSGRI